MTVDYAKLNTECDCRLCKVKHLMWMSIMQSKTLDATVDYAKLNTGCDCRLCKVKQ